MEGNLKEEEREGRTEDAMGITLTMIPTLPVVVSSELRQWRPLLCWGESVCGGNDKFLGEETRL